MRTGPINTPEELEAALGENIRTLRLQRNLDQKTLSAQAGVSLGALRHLEEGSGSTVRSLAKVLSALGVAQGLTKLAPVATIDPYALTRTAQPRQRARRRLAKKAAA
jgi:transcriptional regulator with XRE-family HTH domain